MVIFETPLDGSSTQSTARWSLKQEEIVQQQQQEVVKRPKRRTTFFQIDLRQNETFLIPSIDYLTESESEKESSMV
jgi:hypothetical protein